MALSRMSVGVNRAYTPAAANEIFLSLSPASNSTLQSGQNTNMAALFLVGVDIYNRNTNSKSITLVRNRFDQLHATEQAIGVGNSYDGDVNGLFGLVSTYTTQPTVIFGPPLASIQLGPNIGDSATIRFDEPVETTGTLNSLTNAVNELSLRVAETTALDVFVTFIYEVVGSDAL